MQDRRIRPSRLYGWTQCEQRQLYEEEHRPEFPVLPAPMWVGLLAHKLLIEGHDRIENLEALGVDTLTPTLKQGRSQAHMICRAAKEIIRERNYTVLLREQHVESRLVVGRLDMVLFDEITGRRALVDLKTGAMSGTVWLQLGAYLSTNLSGSPQDVGLLHVPRVPLSRPCTGELHVRDAREVMNATLPVLARALDVQNGRAQALRTPGNWCGGCPIRESCAVAA